MKLTIEEVDDIIRQCFADLAGQPEVNKNKIIVNALNLLQDCIFSVTTDLAICKKMLAKRNK